MHENRSLGEGVELVCESTFLPEGNWTIRKGDRIWSKVEGWKKYYEENRADTHFETAEDALKAWEDRNKVEPNATVSEEES